MSPASYSIFSHAATCRRLLLIVALAALFTGCGGGGSGSSGTQPGADFTLASATSSLTVQQLGNAVAYTVGIIPGNGFSGTVSITFLNLPTGVTISPPGPYAAAVGQALTVNFIASQSAAVGNSSITVQGTSGNQTNTLPLGISVTAAIQFQINATPSTVNIGPNGTATAQLTLVPGSNFGNNNVALGFPSVHIGNTGVDMNLSTQTLTPAQPTATVSFQSYAEVQTGNGIPVPITATVENVVVTPSLALNISNPAPACASLSRSTTRRTDMDPTGVVYDPVHKLVFAAVDQTNSVQVYSSVDAHTVATIPIPAARALDISADGSQILVGSQTRFLSWVDPVALQVTSQVPAVSSLFGTQIPPTPMEPVLLASGSVLVGPVPPLEWYPSTNTWKNPSPASFNGGGVLKRSADHTAAVVQSGNAIAIFSSAADSFGPVQNITASAVALNSNASQLAVLEASPSIPGGNQVVLFDSQFNILATYQLDNEIFPTDLIFSRDNSLLYVETPGVLMLALSTSNLSLAGVVPNTATGGGGEYPSDIDETEMIFSPGNGERSVIFTDASAPCAVGVNTPVNMSLNPPEGTVTSPAATVLSALQGITSNSQIYFGAPPASPQATPGTNLVYSPPTSVQVTPPSGAQSGAVDVTLTNSDGSLGIALDGFTYGSTILAVATTSGPASGGTSVTLYGYGLAFAQSQIQVTVGGNAAVVTQAFAGPGISPFPFPMDQVTFTTPAGNPGPADIVVTTPVGSATVSGGFDYLQNVQNFPVSGTLAEVVYDSSRQRLYSADYGTNKVYVFDLSSQSFLTPFTVGNSPQALAITPDFTTLVVPNGADSSISIVDLTGQSGTKTVSVANLQGLSQECGPPIPYAVATTSTNQAVIAISCTNTTEGEFIVLDPATQVIGCGSSQGCAAMLANYPAPLSYLLFLTATQDGTEIFSSSNGATGIWNVSADTFISEPFPGGAVQPAAILAANSDDTAFAENFSIGDLSLYQTSLMQDVDYLLTGIFDANAIFGEKMHPSGALLYFPRNSGFDIYDANHGHIRRRVNTGLQIPLTFDSMAIDQTGSEIFLITSTGLAIVNLADLPLSLGNVMPNSGSASGGVSVRLRGSGFQSGAQVSFGTAAAGVAFVDSSTLQVTTPELPVGPARITITNPDGTQYFLDDAFTAN